MVNCNIHTHGMIDGNNWRPKSKMWKRRNKDKARLKATSLQEGIRAALLQGND